MKHKPKFAVKTVGKNNEGSRTTEEQARLTKPSYAQALKSNTNTFKLLNKNLNSVPTQKTINKDTIKKQFEDFFRRIKPRAYFNKKKNINFSS